MNERTVTVEMSESEHRLFIAAPELLEALKLAYELTPRKRLDELGAAERAANLAYIKKKTIAKAEGRE